jgi:hypothetical protein
LIAYNPTSKRHRRAVKSTQSVPIIDMRAGIRLAASGIVRLVHNAIYELSKERQTSPWNGRRLRTRIGYQECNDLFAQIISKGASRDRLLACRLRVAGPDDAYIIVQSADGIAGDSVVVLQPRHATPVGQLARSGAVGSLSSQQRYRIRYVDKLASRIGLAPLR